MMANGVQNTCGLCKTSYSSELVNSIFEGILCFLTVSLLLHNVSTYSYFKSVLGRIQQGSILRRLLFVVYRGDLASDFSQLLVGRITLTRTTTSIL